MANPNTLFHCDSFDQPNYHFLLDLRKPEISMHEKKVQRGQQSFPKDRQNQQTQILRIRIQRRKRAHEGLRRRPSGLEIRLLAHFQVQERPQDHFHHDDYIVCHLFDLLRTFVCHE